MQETLKKASSAEVIVFGSGIQKEKPVSLFFFVVVVVERPIGPGKTTKLQKQLQECGKSRSEN